MSITRLPWIFEDQREFLSKGYLDKGETPEQRYQTIADTVQFWVDTMNSKSLNKDLKKVDYNKVKDIGKRFEGYFEKGWVSLATPVLKNFGKKDNLPISCNKSILSDSLDDITKGINELSMLAKYGAGTSQNFSKIRPLNSEISTGGTSNSVMDWIELYADMMSKTAQNRARRGFLTAYLSADHDEINDFLDIGTHRIPAERQRFLNTITTAVTLPIGWRDDLKQNPEKKKVFTKILNTRKEIGYPYIQDLTNANEGRPQVYKDKGMFIETSNICIETSEYTDETKTFACCLSSVNLYYYEEWKDDPNFIFDMNILLDCVIEEYIEKGKNLPGLEKAIRFAKEHRSIGLGVTAFVTYLQKNSIAIGSLESYQKNYEIFNLLKIKSENASKWMADNWGEPEILKGYGLRNTTRLAQAPKKSTTFIDGGTHLALSEGIEPHISNYGEKKLAKIQVTFKNKELEKVLKSYGKDNQSVWDSILEQNGSVQHLSFLTDHEKNVFKTFSEVSQADIIKLAAQRAPLIDQGQSVNIMIHPDTPAKDLINLHLMAFDEGLKSLYYQHSINAAQKFTQSMLECSACEG